MVEPLVRALVVVALAIDAVVHLRLAPNAELASPGGIGGGWLFRIQAVAAILAALFLVVRGSRLAYLLAGLVALSAFGAVLLYSFVNVPAIGPIPSMYDPQWYPEKTLSAVAEGFGVLFAALGVHLRSRSPARTAEPAPG
jgi:hypothetical protein